MSHNLGKYRFILSNLKYHQYDKGNKTDLNMENDFYSLIQKKRKRHYSNKKNDNYNYNIYKCPSCASSLLNKYYKHIHEINNCPHINKKVDIESSLNDHQFKELNYQLSNPIISNSPKEYIYPQINKINNNINIHDNNINNNDKNTNINDKNININDKNTNINDKNININDNNININEINRNKIIYDNNAFSNKEKESNMHKNKKDENKKIIIEIEKKISKNNNEFLKDNKNNEDIRNNASGGKKTMGKNVKFSDDYYYNLNVEKDYFENDRLSEEQKNKNKKQNIFECKLIRSSRKNNKVHKPKKNKKIILKVEKCIADKI